MTLSSEHPPKSRWALLRWLFSLLISISLVVYLLRLVDPREVVSTLRAIHLPSLSAYLVVSLLGLTVRVLRYWLLLERKVKVWPLTLVTLVRNFTVDLIPARIGSLSYVYLMTTRAGASLDAALSSFLLAFIFDVAAIAPLLLLALLVVGSSAPLSPVSLAIPAGVLLLLSLLALFLVRPGLQWSARWSLWSSRWWPFSRIPGFSQVSVKLEQTAEQVQRAWNHGTMVPIFLISLLVRLTKFGGMYCLLHAVLVPRGYDWGSLGVFRTFLGIAGAELSATLPIHGIAGLGTYEAAWALTFTQFGFPTDIAIVSGFATHLITQVQDYTLGLLAFLWIMRPGFVVRHSSG